MKIYLSLNYHSNNKNLPIIQIARSFFNNNDCKQRKSWEIFDLQSVLTYTMNLGHKKSTDNIPKNDDLT